MPRRTAALFLALSLMPASAAAQGRGTEAEQEACTPDVFRLCSDLIPNEGPILACLQAKHAQLSAACEPVIFPRADAPAPPSAPRHARRRHRRRAAS